MRMVVPYGETANGGSLFGNPTPAPAPVVQTVRDPFIFLKNQSPEECHILITQAPVVLVVTVGYLYLVIVIK